MSKLKENIRATRNKLVTTAKNVYGEVKTYWSHPNKAKGEYISYKEFTNFCIGATCSNSIASLQGYITFAAGCLLVGSIYGIGFQDIYLIGFINLPLSYLMNPINMLVQDNLGQLSKKLKIFVHTTCALLVVLGAALMFVPAAPFEVIMPAFPQLVGVSFLTSALIVYFKIGMYRSLSKKFGKFRPWILAGAVPCVVSLCLMVYLPFKDWEYPLRLWVLYALFQLFNNFIAFASQISNLANVVSPNTEERGKLMSIGCFIYSSVPSLVGILVPVFATMLGGLTLIKPYRVLFPALFVLFAVGVIICFGFGVKEKTIISAEHKPNVTFAGFKEVLKNKYFWITNLSNLGIAITAGSVALTNGLAVYALRADWLLGIYSGIIGTASIPGLLLAPYLMRKFGKKKLMLLSKFASVVAAGFNIIAIMTNSFVLLVLFAYIQILLTGPAGVAQNAMVADVWDYQQWRSGERLDGCSGVFSLILQPLHLVAGMLIPAVYAFMGFTTDWDILYIEPLRNKILIVTTIIGVVAGILAAIPYFFYDLTDDKHRIYIQEIKEREGFVDETDEIGGELATDAAGAQGGQPDTSHYEEVMTAELADTDNDSSQDNKIL